MARIIICLVLSLFSAAIAQQPRAWTTAYPNHPNRTTLRWSQPWTPLPTSSPVGPTVVQYCDFDHMCDLKPKMNPNQEFITTAKALRRMHLHGPWFDRSTGSSNGKFGFIQPSRMPMGETFETSYITERDPVCMILWYQMDCPGVSMEVYWTDGNRKVGILDIQEQDNNYWKVAVVTINPQVSRYQIQLKVKVEQSRVSPMRCVAALDDFVIVKNSCPALPPGTSMNQASQPIIRLAGGNQSHEGRVEVFHMGKWGTICGHFGWNEAVTVCRQLGFTGGRINNIGSFHEGAPLPLLDGIVCPGFGSHTLESCHHKGYGETSCDPEYFAQIRCNEYETKTGDRLQLSMDSPRLVQDEGREIADRVRGRVMVKHRAEWGAVCAEGWDRNDAQTVCSMLGFHGEAEASSLPEQEKFPYVASRVDCQKGDPDLFKCSMKWTDGRCDRYAYATCKSLKKHVPYECDLTEGKPCEMYDVTDDDANWTEQRGVMLKRSFNHFENGTATIRTKTFDAGPLNTGMCVEFEYVINGHYPGGLNVYMQTDDNMKAERVRWIPEFSKSGTFESKVDIMRNRFMLLFEATIGPGYYGEVGIVSLEVTEGHCEGEERETERTTTTTTAMPPRGTGEKLVDCDFEKVTCDTMENMVGQDFALNRRSGSTPSGGTGPSSARGGSYYIYMEASSPRTRDQKSGLQSKKMFPAVAYPRCLTLWYHMDGSNMGTLNIKWNNKVLETRTGHQGNKWHNMTVSTPMEAGRLILETVRGDSYKSDIALDDVLLKDEPCDTGERKPCNPSPCLNGGTCHMDGERSVCTCRRGYYGHRCQDTNACLSNPCQNAGTCHRVGSGYRCECLLGITGEHCHIKPDPCQSYPCRNGGQCYRDGTTFRCRCRDGFTGYRCENGQDFCKLTNPCRNGGRCYSIGNNFNCSCPNGWTGRYCEMPRQDFCKLRNPCLNGGRCYSIGNNNFTCSCPNTWTGRYCEVPGQDLCKLRNPCRNGGRCYTIGNNNFTCSCPNGWTGRYCEMPVRNVCNPNPCRNGGRCYPSGNNNFTCICLNGGSGPLCEKQDVNRCDSNPCQNGATCYRNGSSMCRCMFGYYGTYCQFRNATDPCSTSPCLNGGVCENVQGRARCRCPTGFGGDFCSTPDDLPKEECGFDKQDDWCKFKVVASNDQYKYEWTWRQSSTPSGNTGPERDHSKNGGYVYLETSQRTRNASARFESRELPGGVYCLKYWYFMWGRDMGRLEIHVVVNNTKTRSMTMKKLSCIPENGKDGGEPYGLNAHREWKEKSVEIVGTPGTNMKVCFDGFVGSGYRSDIALDDINITPGACKS